MLVNKIQSLSTATHFRAQSNLKSEYENPISRKTEKNLSILSSIGGAAAGGLFVGCLVSTFARKSAVLSGVIAAAAILGVTLPAKIYNAKVGAFAREKEMDVFSRDRELKSGLTEQVHEEVKDKNVSLDKKLDDNLKLQMANRGAGIAIANVTPQVQA